MFLIGAGGVCSTERQRFQRQVRGQNTGMQSRKSPFRIQDSGGAFFCGTLGGMDEREVRTQKELADIVAVLTEVTGLPSRWSGRVELVPDAEFKGRKRQMCDIQIDADLSDREERWATLIHEALHSISAGYNGMDFRVLRGWEEGVAEQLQRLYRPIVLRRLGVNLEESVFLSNELHHQFDPYIAALESLRHLNEPPKWCIR